MSITITALYTAILSLIVVALAINVTAHRVKLSVPLGDGGNPQMLRMIRLHANAAEYIPLACLLMLIYEINSGWHAALHTAGIVLIVARLVQTWNMWETENAGFGRRTGQALTWLTIIVLALLNVWQIAHAG